MIKGPWPESADGMGHIIPLEPPFFTPRFGGERVAIRVSLFDKEKVTRGPGDKGIVTDLDTGKTYRLRGRPCNLPNCYCDAEIEEIKR